MCEKFPNGFHLTRPSVSTFSHLIGMTHKRLFAHITKWSDNRVCWGRSRFIGIFSRMPMPVQSIFFSSPCDSLRDFVIFRFHDLHCENEIYGRTLLFSRSSNSICDDVFYVRKLRSKRSRTAIRLSILFFLCWIYIKVALLCVVYVRESGKSTVETHICESFSFARLASSRITHRHAHAHTHTLTCGPIK